MALWSKVFGAFATSLRFSSGRSFHAAAVMSQQDKSSPVWKLGKLNHVAIAVPDLDKATAFYRDVLGGKVSASQALPEHGVSTVFVELGDSKLELLHPLGENSPIANFLEKNKNGGIHHICIEVSDITKALEQVRANNIKTLGKEPRIGAHGKPVMFLHPKDCNGTLVELEQE